MVIRTFLFINCFGPRAVLDSLRPAGRSRRSENSRILIVTSNSGLTLGLWLAA